MKPAAKVGPLLLASQCCQLAHTIWTENRSLISQDELVDLLVQHAEICTDLGDLVSGVFLSFVYFTANFFSIVTTQCTTTPYMRVRR